MAAYASNGPAFAVKKLASLVFLLLGVLLIALGVTERSSWQTVLGALLLAARSLIGARSPDATKPLRHDRQCERMLISIAADANGAVPARIPGGGTNWRRR